MKLLFFLYFCLLSIRVESLRLIAIGHRQSIDASVTYETWFNQFNRTDLYDLKSHDSTIIVFGESTGFTAAFIGTRGQHARTQSGTIQDALLSLMQSYEKQMTSYLTKYSNISMINALELSLSDVMWRSFNQTFSSLSRSLNATIVSATIGPRLIRSTDPKDIEFYGDPDLYPNQTEVYLPLTKEIYNTAHVYAPNGSLIASRDKCHLTPAEIELLQLVPGKLEDNRVIEPNNLCIAICIDAFYSNVLSYLDSQNCTILIQPSFNAQMWAANVSATSAIWQPSDWAYGPLGLFKKTQNIQFSINPMVTGNLFRDMIVDGQSTINQRLSKENQSQNKTTDLYIGLDWIDVQDIGQFQTLVMSKWARDDPRDGNLTKSERRQLLHQYAQELAPNSKSPNENKYADTVIWTDVII
ncbi:unnamed protein product [Adineta steineri]|uniref:CN hydrolase domain-containing protein n=1 Tax=Adineta steineri TaxID=433720 RepID=A0A819AYK2_9BILA|nr:unnamed protein product [Adineta steineri]CAF3791711.1 unnamed protein product [Adineta steineri]